MRELRQENEALRKKLARGSADSIMSAGLTDEELSKLKKKWEEDMQAVIENNEEQMTLMRQSYEEKLKNATRKQVGGFHAVSIGDELPRPRVIGGEAMGRL